MSEHPDHGIPSKVDVSLPDGVSQAAGRGPHAAGVSRPQGQDPAGALNRLGRLVAALDAAAASLEEARSADAIPGLIGAHLHALGIESQISLLDEPIDDSGATREQTIAAATLRMCYVSLAPGLLRKGERLAGRPGIGMTFPLASMATLREVVRSHQAVYLADTAGMIGETMPMLSGDGVNQLRQLARAATAIVAPLVSRGRVLGVMGVWANDLRPEDTPVLRAFARQAGTALDNARLDRDVEHRTRRLEMLSEVGREMAGTLEVEEVLARVVSRAAQALGTGHAGLWLVEDREDVEDDVGAAAHGGVAWPPKTPVVRLGADHGLSQRHHRLGDVLAPTGEVPETPVLRVVRTLRGELYRDLEADEADEVSPEVRRLLLEEGYRGFVAAPVVTAANRAIGAIVVYTRTANTLTLEDEKYLEAIARLAAVAIEQARLFKQLERGRALMEAVFAADPGALAVIQWPEDMVRMANPRLRAWSAHPERDPVGQSIHDLFPHTRISLVNGLGATLEGVRHTGRPITVRAVTLRDAAGEPQQEISLHVAPIRLARETDAQGSEGEAGAASSTHEEVAGQATDEGLLLIMWDKTARQRAEEQLAAQVRRAETLSAVATALESERELPALLRRIAQAARELTNADASGFLLRADPEARFEVAALAGVEARTANALRRAFVPELQLARSLLGDQRPLLVADAPATLTGPDARVFERAKLRAVAATPLIASDGWTMGALVVGHRARGAFTQEHSELLGGLAAQAAAAIERTRALEEARHRADELEAIFASMAEGVAIYDARGHLIRMNAAGERITGRAMIPGESNEQRRDRFVMRRPGGLPLRAEEMPSARAVRGETFHAVEYLVDGENGRDTIISASGSPLRGLDDSTRGAVVVFRNVTQLRQLERRTQEALDALLRVAATLVAPVSSVAPDERAGIALAREEDPEQTGLRVMLGHLCQLAIGVLGCDCVEIDLIDPETHVRTPSAVAGLTEEEEVEWQRASGAGRRLEEAMPPALTSRFVNGEPVVVDTGQPPYTKRPSAFGERVLLALPMSIEGRLVGAMVLSHGPARRGEPRYRYAPEEVALAQGVARLAALAVERQRLMRVAAEVEALRTANALKEEFLSIASHELKTPLTVLQARTQATQRRLVRMGQTEAAKQFAPVQESLNRMLALIQELLDASRIEAGRLELHQEPCDVGALLTQVVNEAREASDRTIVVEGADAPNLRTLGDGERLMQVLANLVDNGLKYSPPDTPVVVRVWRQPAPVRTAGDDGAEESGEAAGELLVSVSDQGIGIPPDEVGQVFARFYRARTSSPRQYGGLGLGLHIAATIVERHGGRIWAESAGPDRGSTFTLTLPALDE